MRLYYIGNKEDNEKFTKTTGLKVDFKEKPLVVITHRNRHTIFSLFEGELTPQIMVELMNQAIYSLSENNIELAPERWEELREAMDTIRVEREATNNSA